jgi:hypothetical protein
MELTLNPIQHSQRNPDTGQFKTGMIPWNKGRKGLCTLGGDKKFKPGHQPHNTRSDGEISIRRDTKSGISYKYIRIRKSKWALLHRITWELHHGKIPCGHVLRFLDGDTMNCDISNLECLSMSDNMNRNRNRKKAAETMKDIWKREKLRLAIDLPPISGFGNRLRR